jgi:hypothetical protein
MIRRSKDLVEIDRLPDTQDEVLTYTCCIDREWYVFAAGIVATSPLKKLPEAASLVDMTLEKPARMLQNLPGSDS